MSLRITRRAAGLAAAAFLSLAAIAGCTSSSSSGQVGAAASSALANPTVSADVAAAEALLTANFKKDFSAAHPYASIKQTIRDTFPQGNLAKIEEFAVKTFTLSVVHPGLTKPNPKRTAWIDGIAKYAIAQGGVPSASPGTASIPGAPASPAGTS